METAVKRSKPLDLLFLFFRYLLVFLLRLPNTTNRFREGRRSPEIFPVSDTIFSICGQAEEADHARTRNRGIVCGGEERKRENRRKKGARVERVAHISWTGQRVGEKVWYYLSAFGTTYPTWCTAHIGNTHTRTHSPAHTHALTLIHVHDLHGSTE